MDMDFQTRFLITRWAIRAFGLVIMGTVFPFLVVMTFRTWRALWRFLRTARNSSAPVVVDIGMPPDWGMASAIQTAPGQRLSAPSNPHPHLPHEQRPRLAQATPPALPTPPG